MEAAAEKEPLDRGHMLHFDMYLMALERAVERELVWPGLICGKDHRGGFGSLWPCESESVHGGIQFELPVLMSPVHRNDHHIVSDIHEETPPALFVGEERGTIV